MQVLFLFSNVPKLIRRSDCPIYLTLQIIGDQWTLLIIRDFVFKDHRNFNQLVKTEGIATNILQNRLNRLLEHNIIVKEQDPTNASAIRYSLTKKGLSLIPVLLEIYRWGANQLPNTDADQQMVRRANEQMDQLVIEINQRLSLTHRPQ